ncbi:PaaI family thioesterase [Saccharopolyspora sp. 5N102]|uniref:PaaI family thioesterase n=1 Tax=Saccharopolyspora sp. 5N102 TaxID=3375155 RepID=UPI0037B27D24
MELPIRPELFAPNGFVHAAALIGLAGTLCGYGCATSLPTGASGFTTFELKTNFLTTAREDVLHCLATSIHSGRSTQLLLRTRILNGLINEYPPTRLDRAGMTFCKPDGHGPATRVRRPQEVRELAGLARARRCHVCRSRCAR